MISTIIFVSLVATVLSIAISYRYRYTYVPVSWVFFGAIALGCLSISVYLIVVITSTDSNHLYIGGMRVVRLILGSIAMLTLMIDVGVILNERNGKVINREG